MTPTKSVNNMRILSGIQPNPLHIGNYFGAIHQWRNMQHEHECFFCIVDLHALTSNHTTPIAQSTFETAAMYLACGLDPQQSTIFIQSAIPYHSELFWLLSTKVPLGWLNRMTQFKDNSTKDPSLGLYTYPVLMAADILLYQATHVPVGEDQKQHIEFTRDLAMRINSLMQTDVFTLPLPLIQKNTARIMSLKDGYKKMSKSDPSTASRILLNDSDESITKKIKSAKTDSGPWPTSIKDLNERAEMHNLLSLLSILNNQPLDHVLHSIQSCKMLKDALCDEMLSFIRPIRTTYTKLLKNHNFVEESIKTGNSIAKEHAYHHFLTIRNNFLNL